ncbi:hypothetical protein [Burkholderia pyrrocinia]|uniref:hypothetical protein n=1 Tax=Burkholderia pyrrocinia TaxID=60550 RepID=UPI001BD0372B|nr:hypothetical protein [Burkholderia pyrrocinia]QVN19531.1 hypothetical protein JYG32_07385 [Burkholderia pyrrocinia]
MAGSRTRNSRADRAAAVARQPRGSAADLECGQLLPEPSACGTLNGRIVIPNSTNRPASSKRIMPIPFSALSTTVAPNSGTAFLPSSATNRR